MSKTKRILWIAPEIKPQMLHKQELLKKHNFHCIWVNNLYEASEHLSELRASIILVSESEHFEQTQSLVLGLSTLVEAKGSRWVFLLENQNPILIQEAAAANFRDFVPGDLPDNIWLFRVLYASSRQALDFPMPGAHINLELPAQLTFPARLVWLNKDRLRLESQLTPPIGTKINLFGPLFKVGATKFVEFTVTGHEQSRLLYRFSSALEGTWKADLVPIDEITNRLKSQAIVSSRPKYRIFVAIKTKDLRKRILSFFQGEQYDCNSALQLKSLLQEPRFFTPDILFIEDSLCCDSHSDRFEKMLSVIPESSPIVALGSNPQITSIKNKFPRRIIIQLVQASRENLDDLVTRYLPAIEELMDMHKGSIYVESDEPLSCISINVPGKILSMHPMTATIACPYPIRNFAIFQIQTPFLSKWIGKNPWLKVTLQKGENSTHDRRKTHSIAGFFMDISHQERTLLAQNLSLFISKILGVFKTSRANQQAQGDEGEKPTNNNESKRNVQEISPALSAYAQDTALTMVKANSQPLTTLATRVESNYRFDIATDLQKYKGLFYFLIFLAVSTLTLSFVTHIIPKFVENYKKSGSVYVDQLKKFSGSTDP